MARRSRISSSRTRSSDLSRTWLKLLCRAVAARTSAANSAPSAALVLAPSPTTSTAPVLPVKKDAKKPSKGLSLKGVVVKKKSKAKTPTTSTHAKKVETEDQSPTAEGKRKYAESEEQPDDSTKRRKASSPEIS
jgi:hypothetical protein